MASGESPDRQEAETPIGYATTVAEITRWTPRVPIRHVSLSVRAAADQLWGRRDRWLRRNRVHFLYLHSLFPDEEKGFRSLLTELSREHRLIAYDEALARIRRGAIDMPYIAFSFDDGLKNCKAAAKILGEFGVRACFFVCPGIVGEGDFGLVSQFCRDALQLPPVELFGWADLEDLRKDGHTIGSHTLSHRNLATISRDELLEEIEGSREILVRRLGSAEHFAWSYGHFSDITPSAVQAVFKAGYLSCASAERGCHVTGVCRPEDLCVRREHIGGAWPLNHCLYFLARSAKNASATSSNWPTGWQVQ